MNTLCLEVSMLVVLAFSVLDLLSVHPLLVLLSAYSCPRLIALTIVRRCLVDFSSPPSLSSLLRCSERSTSTLHST